MFGSFRLTMGMARKGVAVCAAQPGQGHIWYWDMIHWRIVVNWMTYVHIYIHIIYIYIHIYPYTSTYSD